MQASRIVVAVALSLLFLPFPVASAAIATTAAPVLDVTVDTRTTPTAITRTTFDVEITNPGATDLTFTADPNEKGILVGVVIRCITNCGTVAVAAGDSAVVTYQVNVSQIAFSGARSTTTSYSDVATLKIVASDGSSADVPIRVNLAWLDAGLVGIDFTKFAATPKVLPFPCGSADRRFSTQVSVPIRNLGATTADSIQVTAAAFVQGSSEADILDVEIISAPTSLAGGDLLDNNIVIEITADRAIPRNEVQVSLDIAYTSTRDRNPTKYSFPFAIDVPIGVEIDMSPDATATSATNRWIYDFGEVQLLRPASLPFTIRETCGFQDVKLQSTNNIKWITHRPALPFTIEAGSSSQHSMDALLRPGEGANFCFTSGQQQTFSLTPARFGSPQSMGVQLSIDPTLIGVEDAMATANQAASGGDELALAVGTSTRRLTDDLSNRLRNVCEDPEAVTQTLELATVMPLIASVLSNLRATQTALADGELARAADSLLLGLRANDSLTAACEPLDLDVWKTSCLTIQKESTKFYADVAKRLVQAAGEADDQDLTAFQRQRTHGRLALVYTTLGDDVNATLEAAKEDSAYEAVRGHAEAAIAAVAAQESLYDDYEGRTFFRVGDRYVLWAPFLQDSLDTFHRDSDKRWDEAIFHYTEAGDDAGATRVQRLSMTLDADLESSETAQAIVTGIWIGAGVALLLAWIYGIVRFVMDRQRLRIGEGLVLRP